METTVTVKSWCGCGLRLLGFSSGMGGPIRPECGMGLSQENDTEVEYLFACLFYMPIFPIGCYRVNPRKNKIIRKENWKAGEVVWFYVVYWLIPAALIYFIVC
jgi:hypothetical protein